MTLAELSTIVEIYNEFKTDIFNKIGNDLQQQKFIMSSKLNPTDQDDEIYNSRNL